MNESSMTTTLNMIKDFMVAYGLRIAGAIVILIAGFYVARMVKTAIGRVLSQRKIDAGISAFLIKLVDVTLKVLVVFAALSLAGVLTRSVAAMIGTAGFEIGLRIIGAIVVLFSGFYVARFVKTAIGRVLEQRKIDSIITSFIVNLAHVAMMVMTVMAALSLAGVPTTSAVAVIGAAGLAVGLALQGSLSNFAAGFLLIVLRPFKKGDYIEGAGTAGIVDEMQVFNTILNTPDNRRVIVPNSKLTSDNITNYSALPTRRIDLVFGVSYGDDLKQVKAVLQRLAAADSRVLKDPPPQILISELAESSVNVIMRVWVKSGDYWPFKFDMTEKVKLTFDAEGISIPFPQHQIHLVQEKSAS